MLRRSISEEKISIYCDFSWEGGVTIPQNSYKPSWDPVKENSIGSAVSEILRYKHTDKHPVTLL